MPAAFSLRPREKLSCFFVFSFIFFSYKVSVLIIFILENLLSCLLQICFCLLFSRWNEFVVHKSLHFFAKLVLVIV